MTRRTHVKQVRRTECGAACVAILARVPLSAARKVLGHTDGQLTYRTKTEEIRTALANFKLTLGREVHCTEWEAARTKMSLGLVAVNHRVKASGSEEWHWLVYDSNTEPSIFDPRQERPRNWNSRTRLFSYFHVRSDA